MKRAIKRKTHVRRAFEEEYRFAFDEYAKRGGEAGLGCAYEVGRHAMSEKKSLMEIASTHHQALHGMLGDAQRVVPRQLLAAAAEFLAETLSPYEMAHRGVQDAIVALRQLNETLEEEIKRIAHAVHDEAGQLLVAVHLALGDLARNLPEPQKEQVGGAQELLNQVEQQLRRYSHELRPTILDDLGWIPAIRFLAEGVSRRANLSIQIKTTVEGRLSGPVEIALYRIVQEALTNAAKHAKAKRVVIQIGRKNRRVYCSIEDDGVGFDAQAVQLDGKRRGLGFIGMQERLNGIGGTLSIDSARGLGTKLLIQLPAEASNANSHRAG
ncbi:MAG TPA: sensor histidine kinase [Candidatus Acidoferrum sp.]|nr:sensor histidine kinase [Candidatus Acidoferrum sp.]